MSTISSWVDDIIKNNPTNIHQVIRSANKVIFNTLDKEELHIDFLKLLACRLKNIPDIENKLIDMYENIYRCPVCYKIPKDSYYASYREKIRVVVCSRECLDDWIS